MRRWMPLALSGFTAAAGQVLMARELMVSFRGNEMSLGLILASWSAAMAVGSLLATRCRPLQHLTLQHTQVLMPLVLATSLVFARATRPTFGLQTGEIPGLGVMVAASFISLLPLCVVTGMQFPLACRDRPVTRSYVVEAAGAVAGGLAASFALLPVVGPFTIVLILSAMNLAWAALGPCRLASRGALGLMVLAAALLPFTGAIDDRLTAVRWRSESVVASADSRYANLVVTARDGQYSFFVSGTLAFSLPDPDLFRVERAVTLPLLAHPFPSRVLVLGGALAGNMAAASEHPGVKVTGVELDPLLVELAASHGARIPDGTRLVHGDGRRLLAGWDGEFDVVVIDLPGPSTLFFNRYYTAEFFAAVAETLRPGGVVSLIWPLGDAHASPQMARLTWSVLNAARSGLGGEPVLVPGQPAVILAGPGIKAPPSPLVLSARLSDRDLSTALLTEPYLSFVLGSDQLDRVAELIGPDVGEAANRDLRPRAVYHHLALFASQFSPLSALAYEGIAGLARLWFLWPAAVFLLGRRWASREDRAGTLTVAITGFSGIILSLGLLLAYQSLLGYAYERMGMMYAGFMGGLALGGLHAASRPGRGLRPASMALGMYSLLLAAAVPLLARVGAGPLLELLLALAVAAAGFLEGRIFPLAARLAGPDAGGTLWTADLAGMAAGALLAGTVLLPVAGHMAAFAALGLTNLGLAGFVLRRPSARAPSA